MSLEDRMKAAFTAMVGKVTRRIDYLGMYPATVLKDHGDNTIDVEPDDARIAKMEAIPIALFLPGVKVEVATDTRVLIGWDGGNPAKPRAYLWTSDSLKILKLYATGEGAIVVVECDDIRMGTEAGAKALAFADQTDARLGALEAFAHPVTGHQHAGGFAPPNLPAPFVAGSAGGNPPGGTTATQLLKGE